MLPAFSRNPSQLSLALWGFHHNVFLPIHAFLMQTGPYLSSTSSIPLLIFRVNFSYTEFPCSRFRPRCRRRYDVYPQCGSSIALLQGETFDRDVHCSGGLVSRLVYAPHHVEQSSEWTPWFCWGHSRKCWTNLRHAFDCMCPHASTSSTATHHPGFRPLCKEICS